MYIRVICVYVFPFSSRHAIFAEIVFWAQFPGPVARTISAFRATITYYSPWLPLLNLIDPVYGLPR